jgi:hypothetical protein
MTSMAAGGIWSELSPSGTRAKPMEGQSRFGFAPCISDVNLLSYGEGIVDFNAEIPDGALDFRMSQQQLHST